MEKTILQNMYNFNERKEIFGFLHDYDITCTSVDLLGDERDEELMKLINEKLKNKKGV